MTDQKQSPDAVPHKDRPSPDVERNSTDGRSNARSQGDSAPLGPPGAGLSDRNGPSDPDSRKQ
jgi:hypothetical protein